MISALAISVAWLGYGADGPVPRVDFHAKLEPARQVLSGSGQVDVECVLGYSAALQEKVRPAIFMDYVDAHDDKIDVFFDNLAYKQKLMPWGTVPQIGLGFVDGQNKPYDQAVADGKYDANLRVLANRLAKLDRAAYLRIGYEFHGVWNGYSPESYKAAYRHVVKILREQKATRVATIWCAEAGALPKDYMKFYPGDDVVDWWGIDLFGANGRDFGDNVGQFMQDSMTHRKPVMIGESTPRSVGVLDGQKSWNAWFEPYFSFIDRHPNVKAFCYINWEWEGYSKWSADWKNWGDGRLQRNPVVANLFRERVSTDMYIHGGALKPLLQKIERNR